MFDNPVWCTFQNSKGYIILSVMFLVVWLNVPNRNHLHKGKYSYSRNQFPHEGLLGLYSLPEASGKVAVQTGQLSFLSCLPVSVCWGWHRGQPSRGCWDESIDGIQTQEISRGLFVGEWQPVQDYTEWWPSPLHLMWIESSPLLPTTSDPFNSNLGRITFHHLGSSLSCSGSDVTWPHDCSKRKKGHIVSGGQCFVVITVGWRGRQTQ